MKPILFRADETKFDTYGLGEIDAIKAIVTRERNGNYLLYIEYPSAGYMANLFQREMKIKADAGVRTTNQTFEISRINKNSDNIIKIYAKHISHKTEQMALAPSVSVVKSGADVALKNWASNLVGGIKFDTWSDIRTENSTTWTVDKVSNAREALGGVSGSILDVWGGEFEFDNTTIKLHKQLGRKTPTVLEYGRNILSAEEDEDIENIYTSIYPFALYTPAPEEAHSGQLNPILVTLPERFIDGEHIDSYANRRVQIVDLSSKFGEREIPTVDKLRQHATSYLKSNNVGVPKINTKIKYIDLSTTLDYQDLSIIEEIELCDIVPIYYPTLGITSTDAKVTTIEYNVLLDRNESVEIGTIGTGIRSAMTGNIGERLDYMETSQKRVTEVIPYLLNNQGNRVWLVKPDNTTEHKIGDIWFEENGLYDRMWLWNGIDWIKQLDTEDIDEVSRRVDEQERRLQSAIVSAGEAQTTADNALNMVNLNADLIDDHRQKIDGVEGILLSYEYTVRENYNLANQALSQADSVKITADTALADAKKALSGVESNQLAIRQTESELSLKADKTDLDLTKQQVDKNTLAITVNADGLASKADRSLVDVIDRKVTNHSTLIEQNAKEISTKANASTVNSLSQTVSTQATQLRQTADAVALKADKSLVDDINKTIDSHSLSIKANADSLLTKASQQSVNTLSGQVSNLSNTITTTANGTRQEIAKVEAKIDGLEIGGRNLIRNTNQDWHYVRNLTTWHEWITGLISVESGHAYTYSVEWQKGLHDQRLQVRYHSESGSTDNVGIVLYGDHQNGRHSMTFTVPEGVSHVQLGFRVTQPWVNNNFNWRMPKLEIGNVATDWSPAPEDLLSQSEYQTFKNIIENTVNSNTATISSLQNLKADKTQLGGYATVSTVNQIKQTADSNRQLISQHKQSRDSQLIRYNEIVNTVDRHSQTIGSDGGNIARKVMSDRLFQTEVIGKIPTEIGGRNLIRNSDNLTINPRTGTSETLTQYLGVSNVTKILNPTTAMHMVPAELISEPLQAGQTYTLSALFTYSGTKGTINQFYLSYEAGGYQSVKGDIEEGKFNRVFITVTPRSNLNPRIHMNFNGYKEIYLSKWKLEKGTVATDWTPAPEDVATTSQITQLSDLIGARVEKNNLIGEINLQAGRALIRAGDNYLNVTPSTTYIQNGTIKSAHIQSLDANKITTGTLNAANVRIINLDVNNLSGNRAELVSAGFNGINSNLQIDSNGITARDGSGNYAQMTGLPEFKTFGADDTMVTMTKGQLQFDWGNRPVFAVGNNVVKDGSGILLEKNAWFNLMQKSDITVSADRYHVVQRGQNPVWILENVFPGFNPNRWSDSAAKLKRMNGWGARWPVLQPGDKVKIAEGSRAVVGTDTVRYIFHTQSPSASHNGKIVFDYQADFMGGLNQASDRRIKHDIKPTQVKALDHIRNLSMKEFKFNKDGRFEPIGLIAQEAGILRVPDEDLEGVDIQRSIMLALKGIQELHAMMERS